MMEFAYRIEKCAKCAYDTETGEPSECYMTIKIDNCRDLNKEEYDAAHISLRKELGIPLEFVTPFSMEEYRKQMDEL